MRIGVPKEIRVGEARVALAPEVIGKLVKQGIEVVIEKGAGTLSGFDDGQYEKAGAKIGTANVISDSDVVASVTALTPEQMRSLKKGAITVSFLSPKIGRAHV